MRPSLYDAEFRNPSRVHLCSVFDEGLATIDARLMKKLAGVEEQGQ